MKITYQITVHVGSGKINPFFLKKLLHHNRYLKTAISDSGFGLGK